MPIEWNSFFIANGIPATEGDRRRAVLLTVIGPETYIALRALLSSSTVTAEAGGGGGGQGGKLPPTERRAGANMSFCHLI